MPRHSLASPLQQLESENSSAGLPSIVKASHIYQVESRMLDLILGSALPQDFPL